MMVGRDQSACPYNLIYEIHQHRKIWYVKFKNLNE
jgi:hypothetical protein